MFLCRSTSNLAKYLLAEGFFIIVHSTDKIAIHQAETLFMASQTKWVLKFQKNFNRTRGHIHMV